VTPIKMTKAMLPNLPGEVFDMFITQINETESTTFDSMPGGRWFYYFGELSVEAFNHLIWRRTTLFFNKDIFHPVSCSDVDTLIHYCGLNSETMAMALYPRYPVDSKARFAWHKEFIKKTGRLCAPIVVIRTIEGIRFLDGCHRLAAAFSLELHDSIPLDAWIGEP
jgi:hypothetical protein